MSFPFLKTYDQPDFSTKCDEAFFNAIKRSDVESCESFIESRPPHYVEKLVDPEGNNPLHIAVQTWEGVGINDVALQLDLIQLFIALGVDPAAQNAHGVSALDLAKKSSCPEIVSYFDSMFAPSLPEPTEVVELQPFPSVTSPRASSAMASAIGSPSLPVAPSPSVPVAQLPSLSSQPSVVGQAMVVSSPSLPAKTPSSLPAKTPSSLPAKTPSSLDASTPALSKPAGEIASEVVDNDQECEMAASLSPSTAVEELLTHTGMQEYKELFEEKVRPRRLHHP